MATEERFELAIGKVEQGKLQFAKHTGLAIKAIDEDYFMLRLSMFPNVNYFLSKNASQDGTYTIFSKSYRAEGGVKFQNPVGFAKLRADLRTHMEVRFNLFEKPIFMSLFPC